MVLSKKAEIKVENIKGPILIISGKNDDQWSATAMSNKIVERLQAHNFSYYNEHIVLDGGYIAPLEQFNVVFSFLEHYVPVK